MADTGIKNIKKTAIFMADGCEEIEGLTVVDLLRRAGIEIDMIAIKDIKDGLQVRGSHGIAFEADKNITEINLQEYDGIILPGGMPGTNYLKADSRVRNAVIEFNQAGKLVAAICAAPTVLGDCGILNGKNAICYPGLEEKLTGANIVTQSVVKDGNMITSRGMGTAIEFGLAIIAYFLGQEQADDMARKIVFN